MKKMLLLTALLLFSLIFSAHAADFTTTKVDTGSVNVYTFGDYKLHAYNTMDAMADEAFLLETKTNLIAIEAPAFVANIDAWKKYIAGLKKPLDAVLLSYHTNGGKWYGNAKSYATQAAADGRTKGGIKGLADNLGSAFGKDFNTDITEVDVIIKPGSNKISGVDFIITDDSEGMAIEIPAIKSVYVHMLGADSHSIFANTDHMDAYIKTLESYKSKDFKLILSSHHTPEEASALDTKIVYVKKAREIALSSKTAADYISRMKAVSPAYTGVNYLEMSAGMMFK